MSLFLDSVSELSKIRIVSASGIINRPAHVVGDKFYTINNFNYPVVSSDGGTSWQVLTLNPPLNLIFSSIGHSNLDIFFKQSTFGSSDVFALSELSRAAALNIAPVKISNWSGNTFPQSSRSFRKFIYDGDYISAKSFFIDTSLQELVLFKQTQSGSSSLRGEFNSYDLSDSGVGFTKTLAITTGDNNDGVLYWPLPSQGGSNFALLSQLTDGVERIIYPWTLCEAETSSSAERGLACVFASSLGGGNRGIYRIYKDNVTVFGTARPRVEFFPVNYPIQFISLNSSSNGTSFNITDDGKIFVAYNIQATTSPPTYTSSVRWISQSFGSDWTQLTTLPAITTPVEDSFKISADGRNQIIRAGTGLYISTNYGY